MMGTRRMRATYLIARVTSKPFWIGISMSTLTI